MWTGVPVERSMMGDSGGESLISLLELDGDAVQGGLEKGMAVLVLVVLVLGWEEEIVVIPVKTQSEYETLGPPLKPRNLCPSLADLTDPFSLSLQQLRPRPPTARRRKRTYRSTAAASRLPKPRRSWSRRIRPGRSAWI